MRSETRRTSRRFIDSSSRRTSSLQRWRYAPRLWFWLHIELSGFANDEDADVRDDVGGGAGTDAVDEDRDKDDDAGALTLTFDG